MVVMCHPFSDGVLQFPGEVERTQTAITLSNEAKPGIAGLLLTRRKCTLNLVGLRSYKSVLGVWSEISWIQPVTDSLKPDMQLGFNITTPFQDKDYRQARDL